MENNLKWYYVFGFFFSLMAYILGTTLSTLVFGDNAWSNQIMGFAFWGLALVLFVVHEKRSERLKTANRRIENDERIRMIRGKAASHTVGVTLVILFLTVIISEILSLQAIGIFSAMLYLVMMLMMIVGQRHWNRKL